MAASFISMLKPPPKSLSSMAASALALGDSFDLWAHAPEDFGLVAVVRRVASSARKCEMASTAVHSCSTPSNPTTGKDSEIPEPLYGSDGEDDDGGEAAPSGASARAMGAPAVKRPSKASRAVKWSGSWKNQFASGSNGSPAGS